MTEYVAADGTPLTDDLIESWAREAEDGFPNSALVRESNPFSMRSSSMRPHTIRVSDALWSLVEKRAKDEGLTVSEYAREALASQLAR